MTVFWGSSIFSLTPFIGIPWGNAKLLTVPGEFAKDDKHYLDEKAPHAKEDFVTMYIVEHAWW